jgi:hypothetical protein
MAPQALDLGPCEEFAYSTEEDFVTQGPEPPDGNPIISDGDLLSRDCTICARNHDLIVAFDIGPEIDLGLDAADVIQAETDWIAFSTELDSSNGALQFTAGDLLIIHDPTGGALVTTVVPNFALMYLFNITYDIGLDGVHFVGAQDDIMAFLRTIEGMQRSDWTDPADLPGLLNEFGIDIWFSTEGTGPPVETPAFLDGDLLSAASGIIVAGNGLLLPASVPAGIPNRGVDFGLDAVTSSRVPSRQNIRFSTEILYNNGLSFTDGDVLEMGTGVILAKNEDLIACFEPRAGFLGLDALHIRIESVQEDVPFITDIGQIPTGDINGGSVSVGGPGTGLATLTGYQRPFGGWVPVHGNIPASIYEFRVVYRDVGTSRPGTPSSAMGIPVVPSDGWNADLWDGMSCGNIWLPHASDADGWFNASDYLTLKGNACSSNLALTVWDSTNAPDPDGHYVIWLQWRESMGGPIIEESFDHHVQFDNTAPSNLGLDIPGGACTGYTSTDMPIMALGRFDDEHFWRYRLRIFGGNPPSGHWYSVVTYDSDPDVGPTGTGGIYVDLHEVDVNDLSSVVDCCYGVRLWVEDRTIIGGFHPSIDLMPWGIGYENTIEITFDYDAP